MNDDRLSIIDVDEAWAWALGTLSNMSKYCGVVLDFITNPGFWTRVHMRGLRQWTYPSL